MLLERGGGYGLDYKNDTSLGELWHYPSHFLRRIQLCFLKEGEEHCLNSQKAIVVPVNWGTIQTNFNKRIQL